MKNSGARQSMVVALVSGGTGGHIFPALAVARVLEARAIKPVLITDERGQDFTAKEEWLEQHILSADALKGGGLGTLVALPGSVLEARRLLSHINPSAVVGFGGYTSLSAMIAAKWKGIATCIHEQNAVVGRVNRLTGRFVDAVALSFEATRGLKGRAAGRAYVTGNPVRSEIAGLADQSYSPPKPDGIVRLLILGGSQGASIFSEIVPAAILAMPPAQRERIQITQQCRVESIDQARQAYEEAGVAAELEPFFEDLAERLTWAHLVIARAGASTISELEVAGRPAILVPLPTAMNDHQTENARLLDAGEGGWLVPQAEFTPAELAKRLQKLIIRPETLLNAAVKAKALSKPDAAGRLADLIEHLAEPVASGKYPEAEIVIEGQNRFDRLVMRSSI